MLFRVLGRVLFGVLVVLCMRGVLRGRLRGGGVRVLGGVIGMLVHVGTVGLENASSEWKGPFDVLEQQS